MASLFQASRKHSTPFVLTVSLYVSGSLYLNNLDTIAIAIGVIIMMWPILTKVQYEQLPKLFASSRIWIHLGISLFLNWNRRDPSRACAVRPPPAPLPIHGRFRITTPLRLLCLLRGYYSHSYTSYTIHPIPRRSFDTLDPRTPLILYKPSPSLRCPYSSPLQRRHHCPVCCSDLKCWRRTWRPSTFFLTSTISSHHQTVSHAVNANAPAHETGVEKESQSRTPYPHHHSSRTLGLDYCHC